MRFLLLLFTITLTSTASGQPKIFDLTSRDSLAFTEFVAEKKIIAVGELHGTAEIPLFVSRLVRQLWSRQKHLTVGLEIPVTYQSNLDRNSAIPTPTTLS